MGRSVGGPKLALWTTQPRTEKNDIKFFTYKPAGLMGTPELTNYMKRMTPGEFVKKINKKDKVATT